MPVLYTITSSLHQEVSSDVLHEPFIRDICDALGEEMIFKGSDFSDFGVHPIELIYIRTGGTEGIFKSLGLKGHIRLLTSGKSNSLAASMEILSYLRSQGRTGEILHGDPDYIASRIREGGEEKDTCHSKFLRPLPPSDFGGKRAGIIGKPSDWLISSDTDPAKVKNKLNVELVDIPIAELIDEVREYDGDPRSFEGSEEIYRVLKKIILKYDLQALTIRCFDLLDTLHNTGCLALARLNAEGFPASCEGDIPALLTMMMAQQKTGCSGFQSNLSRIEGDNLLFAHCTVPLNMVVSFKYDTHFESGLGTAVKGVLPEGPVTIMKVSPDLESMVVIPGEITANTSEQMLCRTQVIVHATGARDYFLHAPLANHHVIVPGLVF